MSPKAGSVFLRSQGRARRARLASAFGLPCLKYQAITKACAMKMSGTVRSAARRLLVALDGRWPWQARSGAIRELGKVRYIDSVQPLLELLSHEHLGVLVNLMFSKIYGICPQNLGNGQPWLCFPSSASAESTRLIRDFWMTWHAEHGEELRELLGQPASGAR